MIVQAEYEDGSRTVIYEPGDRVRLLKVPHHASWLAKPGELATVIRRDRPRVEGQPTSIDFLDVRTDAMAAGNWGSLHVSAVGRGNYRIPVNRSESELTPCNQTSSQSGLIIRLKPIIRDRLQRAAIAPNQRDYEAAQRELNARTQSLYDELLRIEQMQTSLIAELSR